MARNTPESSVLASSLLDDSKANAVNIRTAAATLGFKLDGSLNAPASAQSATAPKSPERMLNVFRCNRGQAQAIVISSSNSVQAGLALNLLAAIQDPFHSFRKIAIQWPDLILALEEVLNLRNHVLHGSAGAGDTTSLFSRVLGGIQAAFGADVKPEQSAGSLNGPTMAAHAKLRQSLTLDIGLQYGDQLPIHALHLLVNVKRELAMASSAISADSSPRSQTDSRVNIASAVVNSYKLIENLLDPVLKPLAFEVATGPDPHWLQLHPGLAEVITPFWGPSGWRAAFPREFRQRLAGVLLEAMRHAGFDAPSSNHIPEYFNSILYVRPNRLVYALQGGRVPLSARIAALTLLIPRSESLQRLVKAQPKFIVETARLCHWRGHGECREAPVDPLEVQGVVEELVGGLLPLQPIE